MDTNNQWQQPYGVQQQNNKKGLSIAAFIIGILSVVLCFCFGWIPGVIGFVMAIIALVKEPRGKGFSITGLILSIIGSLLSLFCMFINFSGIMADVLNDLRYEIKVADDHFWGSRYVGSDDSVIYFYEDNTFDWFLTDSDYDNVKSGEYEVIFGKEARKWMVYEHPEYGVTDKELDDYYERNADSDFYTEENLTVLILTTEIAKMDGEKQNEEPYTVYYYGYSNELGFDGVNLSTFNYMILTPK